MIKLLHLWCAIILTIALAKVCTTEVANNTSADYANDHGNTALPTTNTDAAELSTYTESLEESGVTVANEARRIAPSYDNNPATTFDVNDAALQAKLHSKPLKNIFRSIYKSYKSTYMGNATAAEYKKRLRQQLGVAAVATTSTDKNLQPKDAPPAAAMTHEASPVTLMTHEALESNMTASSALPLLAVAAAAQEAASYQHRLEEKQRKRKLDNVNTLTPDDYSNYRYNLGPGVNMSFDMLNDIVNVKLDGDNLREIMRGRWLSDDTEEGRGKKYDIMTKVLPLFVLPFLIQSAIVPFLVMKLKLLLIKSIVVGKLAIFLLILSAMKNSNKAAQSYEAAPSYWAGEPSRRSELAAVPSATSYNGYRVEGKPAAWIN